MNIVGMMDSNVNIINDRFKLSGDFFSWFCMLINIESILELLKFDSVIVNCFIRWDCKFINVFGN